jgi:hypothetical protein
MLGPQASCFTKWDNVGLPLRMEGVNVTLAADHHAVRNRLKFFLEFKNVSLVELTQSNVRFQVLTAASMKFRFVFWDVLPCKIIFDPRFRGACCVHHQGVVFYPKINPNRFFKLGFSS